MATKKTETIVINPLQTVETEIKIVGDTPLVMHAWNVKAKREMLEKQMNLAKTKSRAVKNPQEDFISSAYWLTKMPETFDEEAIEAAFNGARFGFPCSAFKSATLATASRLKWNVAKTVMNTAFWILPNSPTYFTGDIEYIEETKSLKIIPNIEKRQDMVEIFSDRPVLREDMVKVGTVSKTADIRYRAEFDNWYAIVTLSYVKDGAISLEQILNALNAAGKVTGIGEMRPEKGLNYGAFHIEA